MEFALVEGQNAFPKFESPLPKTKRRWAVASGVELAPCELEHQDESSKVVGSTAIVRMPSLETAAVRSLCNHPVTKARDLATATPAASTAGTPCVLPDAWSGTESTTDETGSADAGGKRCDDPPVLTPQTTRKTRGKQLEKKKFLEANLCCSQGNCGTVEKQNELNVLVAKEPSGTICTVAEDEWVEIEVAVDSGATETVMAAETLNGIVDITEGPALRRGVTYEVANGVEIRNLGGRKFLGYTEEGGQRGVTAQICAVNKTLMSVSKVTAQGNRAVFDDDGSYIEGKTSGERAWMQQVGGMYMLKMWVSRKTTKEAGF